MSEAEQFYQALRLRHVPTRQSAQHAGLVRRAPWPACAGRAQRNGGTCANAVRDGALNGHYPEAVNLSAQDIAFAQGLVIAEDAHLIAFNKPSGLPVQGGSGVTRSLEDLLAAFAKSNGKRPRLVHRLDRETSGVIIAARTKPAAAFFSEAFAGREAKKAYLAIVCGGAPDPREGEIALKLRKASRKGLDIMEVSGDGQAALTRYRTLAVTPEAALLELTPETGRMHQLRAHLAAIGRPIAGDGKYGGLYRLAGTEISRLMLHAAALELPSPEGGRRRFSAPPPAEFTSAVRSLRLEAPSA